MKVSIVVPVYNPGSAIEPLIASIGGQSMPASEFEAIFVDDGSTDDTPARLDALAAERPNVRVIHEENSGWPGRPRNVGLEAASGEWVYFVDNDDYLAPQALERLYAVATANGADVAIGKEASNWRAVSLGVFGRNRPACTVHDAPLMDTLTPHKMFRRVFLAANGIRFPEGRRRLEDQLFVVRAYLAARVVSVVSDYVCYFYVRRADKRNAGSERIDPHSYFSNVREVIDVIVAHLEAGPARDRLVNRFVRTEMLGRLREPAFARYDPEFRRRLFEAIRELVMDPVTVGAQRGLATFQDLRLRLVREDRLDDLVALAERLSRVSATARLEPPRWAEGRLRLAYTTELRLDGERDRPLVARANGRCLVDRSITAGIVNGPLDVGPDLGSFRVNTYVRESETGTEWPVGTTSAIVPPERSGSDRPSLFLDVAAAFDPERTLGAQPIERGVWAVMARVAAFGLDRRVPLQAPSDHPPAVDPAMIGRTSVVPEFDAGALRLDVNGARRPLGAAIDPTRVAFGRTDGRSIEAALPVAVSLATPAMPVAVVIRSATQRSHPGAAVGLPVIRERVAVPVVEETVVAGALVPRGESMVVTADLPNGQRLPAGLAEIAIRLGRDADAPIALGPAEATEDGRVYPRGARRMVPLEATGRRVAAAVGRGAEPAVARLAWSVEALRHWAPARRMIDRLPPRGKQIARRLYAVVQSRGLRAP